MTPSNSPHPQSRFVVRGEIKAVVGKGRRGHNMNESSSTGR